MNFSKSITLDVLAKVVSSPLRQATVPFFLHLNCFLLWWLRMPVCWTLLGSVSSVLSSFYIPYVKAVFWLQHSCKCQYEQRNCHENPQTYISRGLFMMDNQKIFPPKWDIRDKRQLLLQDLMGNLQLILRENDWGQQGHPLLALEV